MGIIHRTKYEIVGGSNRSEISAVIEFANSKTVTANLALDVSAGPMGSGRRDELLTVDDLKLTGLDLETQPQLQGWIYLRGTCFVNFPDERGERICNYVAFYHPDEKRGEIAFTVIA